MSDEFQKNVLGERLEDCSHQPLTGWFEKWWALLDSNQGPLRYERSALTS